MIVSGIVSSAACTARQLDRLADVEGGLAERQRGREDRHDPEREADVADAVDEERLLRGERRGSLWNQKPISR